MASHFPVGIDSIPEISMVGSQEHEQTSQKIPYETGAARYRKTARGQIPTTIADWSSSCFTAKTVDYWVCTRSAPVRQN